MHLVEEDVVDAVPNDWRLTKTDGIADHLKSEGCGAAPAKKLEAARGKLGAKCRGVYSTVQHTSPAVCKPSNGAIEAILDRTGSPITDVIN